MFLQKKTAAVILITILASASIFAENNKVTISRIKLEIDNARYTWDESFPEDKEDVRISPKAVFSFTELKPGIEISEQKLEKKVKIFETRLNESGLFYTASVNIIPPKRNPQKRTIVVKVMTGFFLRFGGGNAYGYLGNMVTGGRRAEWGITAGANFAGINFVLRNAFNHGIYLNPYIYYKNHLLRSSDLKYHKFRAGSDFGKYLTPDLLTGVGFETETHFYPELSSTPDFDYTITPFIYLTIPGTSFFSSEIKLKGPMIFTQGTFIPSIFAKVNATEEIGLFTLIQTGGLHYLWGNRDSSLLEQYLRVLPTETSVFGSLEAALSIFDTTLFSIMETELEVFIFGEAGSINNYGSGLQPIIYSAGSGLRLALKTPVFTTIELYLNTNNAGSSLLGFRIIGDY
ncbi:MAG: hypothetical protein PQJ46_16840 [Spirochaetales bacterium]|nr:hypothetical protein [Spirochaetales bacterium]